MPFSLPKSLLILAGRGIYPRLLALGARRAGVERIVALGFRGCAARGLRRYVDSFEMLDLGNLTQLLMKVDAAGCDSATMSGQIHPLSLFRTKFDERAREEIGRLTVRNAHTLFGRMTELVGEAGLNVLPASIFMQGHFAPAGVLTKRAPDARESADMRLGFEIGMATCNLDIGQTLVVKDGVVLAVEAFEGTDEAVRRGARLGGPGAVIAKVAKDGHDMRFDIPVIGMKTLAVMRRGRVRTLGVQAGRVLLLEKELVVEEADRLGMVIEAVESGLPHAPVFEYRDDGGGGL